MKINRSALNAQGAAGAWESAHLVTQTKVDVKPDGYYREYLTIIPKD